MSKKTSKPQTQAEQPAKPATAEYQLSDGRTAVIRKGKGRDAMQAQRIAGGDSTKYIYALMAQLVDINGHAVVIEDLEDLDLDDFHQLQAKFSEVNF